eukprot:gene20864-21583_t
MLDSGAIQIDALRNEAQWLKSSAIDMVIVDATPLGCAAGKLAGIPTDDQLKALSLPENRFIAMSFESYVPDLIAASDAVLGKIGYGFVSECIANSTPLIYVPRSDWPEEEAVGLSVGGLATVAHMEHKMAS